MFRDAFVLDENTKILDLGSESGSNIAAVIRGTGVRNENVYIADIQEDAVRKGGREFGFVPVVIDESEQLDFEDRFFDIVYCSSVIEHVTVRAEIAGTDQPDPGERHVGLAGQPIDD